MLVRQPLVSQGALDGRGGVLAMTSHIIGYGWTRWFVAIANETLASVYLLRQGSALQPSDRT